jgi:ECF sigma factor
MGNSSEQLTEVIEAASAGDAQAADELLPLVYAELRRLAAARMAAEPPGQTWIPGRTFMAWASCFTNY